MRQSQKLRDVPLEELKAHPEILLDLLTGGDDISVLLEKHGEIVSFAAMRTYAEKTTQIRDGAKSAHRWRKSQSYSRATTFADLKEIESELRKQQNDGALGRRKDTGRLETMESDRLFRLARVVAHAVEVFEATERARDWLETPNRALGDQRPLDLLDTDAGVREVDNVLGRIEHGIFG